MKNAELFYSTISSCGKIFLKSHKTSKAINIEKVLFCKANGNYTDVFSEEGNNSVCKSLCEFEKQLKNHDFLRVHNSYLVNFKRIEAFSKKDRFVIIAGCNIPISKRKCNDIFPILIDFGIKEVKNHDRLINILSG